MVAGANRREFDPGSVALGSGQGATRAGGRLPSAESSEPLYMSESHRAAASAVPWARKVVAAFAAEAGMGGSRLEDVRLVVSEAVTNSVTYAYDDSPGEIHVLAAAVSGELWIVIADDGEGMRGRQGDTQGLGLGLGLMARLSDALTILTRSSGGVEVRMRFDLR